MEDYEQDYEECCPKCGHSPTHYRDCSELHCDEGYIDENDLDPIDFMEGESYIMCNECYGTGIDEWCPKCGYDISAHKYVVRLREAKLKSAN